MKEFRDTLGSGFAQAQWFWRGGKQPLNSSLALGLSSVKYHSVFNLLSLFLIISRCRTSVCVYLPNVGRKCFHRIVAEN